MDTQRKYSLSSILLHLVGFFFCEQYCIDLFLSYLFSEESLRFLAIFVFEQIIYCYMRFSTKE